MNRNKFLALGGALAAVAALPVGQAIAAGGTKVTVRVEGKTKTLLAQKQVQTHSGWITKGGVPAGQCSAASGQGALDVATHHSWNGTFSTSLGSYFIKTILGETDNGPKIYWSIFVNNASASTGACGIKLHAGDQLLFAATKYPEYPIAIKSPATAKVGQQFNVTVVAYNAGGKSKPLAGATVSVNGHSGKTDSHGIVPLTPSHSGTYTLQAEKAGYIRAASVRLTVS